MRKNALLAIQHTSKCRVECGLRNPGRVFPFLAHAPTETHLLTRTYVRARRWTDLIDPNEAIPADTQFKSIIVQTVDSVALTYLLRTAVEHK